MTRTVISKIMQIVGMAAVALAFVTAFALTGARTASAQLEPMANTAAPVSVGVPLDTSCSQFEGRACAREGTQVHCSTTINEGPGRCLCFEHSWSCNF